MRINRNIYQLIGGGLYFRRHGERGFKVLVNKDQARNEEATRSDAEPLRGNKPVLRNGGANYLAWSEKTQPLDGVWIGRRETLHARYLPRADPRLPVKKRGEVKKGHRVRRHCWG